MTTLQEAAAACCACIRVRWVTTPGPDGTVSGRWVCSTCEREFVPVAELEHLKAELAATEQLVEATQTERSAAIVKLTEVTAERDDLGKLDEEAHRMLDAMLGEGDAESTSMELVTERLTRLAARLLKDGEIAIRKSDYERLIASLPAGPRAVR